ncbi:MAG: response regulator [Deltaproteobacteria bacterium]|jgi:DNA-binding NtrC family response regulator|nr:response regulator [Deltaproteobacteria bacterium]
MNSGTEEKRARLKVLLVDDEKGYAEVLAKRMALRDIHAVIALSGTEAIRILRAQQFDAAVLDLKLEDMDGIEILRVFKKMDPAMPVIMVTGHGSETAARQGMEFGAYDYLMKPCNLNLLIEKIKQACEQ